MSLQTVPSEVLETFIGNLDPEDTFNFRLVNRRFYSIIKERKLLKFAVEKFCFISYERVHSVDVVRLTDAFKQLVNTDTFPAYRNYPKSDRTILEILKFWLFRLAFTGCIKLRKITLNNSIAKLFVNYRNNISYKTQLCLKNVIFDVNNGYLVRQFLSLFSGLELIDCDGWENAISCENLRNLNHLEIKSHEEAEFPILNDQYVEEVLPSMHWFKLIGHPKTSFTFPSIVKVIAAKLELDCLDKFTWVLGRVQRGADALELSLTNLRTVVPTAEFNLIWRYSEDGVCVWVHHKTNSIHISMIVEYDPQ